MKHFSWACCGGDQTLQQHCKKVAIIKYYFQARTQITTLPIADCRDRHLFVFYREGTGHTCTSHPDNARREAAATADHRPQSIPDYRNPFVTLTAFIWYNINEVELRLLNPRCPQLLVATKLLVPTDHCTPAEDSFGSHLPAIRHYVSSTRH